MSGVVSGTFPECAPQCGAAPDDGDSNQYTQVCAQYLDKMLGPLSRRGIAAIGKAQVGRFLVRKPIRGRLADRWPRAISLDCTIWTWPRRPLGYGAAWARSPLARPYPGGPVRSGL